MLLQFLSCLLVITFVFAQSRYSLVLMDFDHRLKGKTGSGPISDAQRQQQQRDRLLKLAMETSDVSKVYITMGKFKE